jgi:glycosyltransferase involved in cell wall biosynthesis
LVDKLILLETTFLKEKNTGISTVINSILHVFNDFGIDYKTISYYKYFAKKKMLLWYIYYNIILNIKVYMLKKSDTFLIPSNIGGLFFLISRNASNILLIYDLFEISENKNIAKKIINKVRFFLIFKNVKKIITISKTSCNNIKTIFPDVKGKVYQIYLFIRNVNQVDEGNGDGKRILSQKVISTVNDNLYFLANGSGQKRKNVDFLIENMQKIWQDFGHKLVLIGKDFYNNQYYEVLSKIKGYGYENLIIHLGEVTNAELIYLYKNATCFIFPSLNEGFGLPPLEALVYDCKIAVSNISIFREIYSEMDCLFDFNYDSLKTVLLYISNNEMYDFNNNKKIILNRFSYDKFSKNLIAALTS